MRLYSPRKEALLKVLYVLFFLIGGVLTLMSRTSGLSFYSLGQIFGTLSLTGLTLQLCMGSRIKVLEKGVGLDKILRLHSVNARLTLLFIVLHPTFMFGPAILQGESYKTILASFTFFHWLGIFALLLIIMTILLTIYQNRLKLNYEHWKIIHKTAYLIIVFGFIHSFFVGPDIATLSPLFYWWIFLAILAILAILYRYGIRHWLLRNSLYQIVKIAKESSNVISIYLKPQRGKIFLFYPGQFAFVKFCSQFLSSEEHHFTISSSPRGNTICFTIKESGDFTRNLNRLKVGDTAKIEGPFGAFSNAGMEGPFVFIAGGIGITPIMSMLSFMKAKRKKEKTLLIYGARKRSDLIFYEELEKLKKESNWFDAAYILSSEKAPREERFHKGYINSNILRSYVPNFKSAKFFLVGPINMMEAIKKILIKEKADRGQIFTEKFALK
ncbi:MAG: ferredoxin reductase family protein [Patescibacteria group bacterium]